jgi:hypothetical protein
MTHLYVDLFERTTDKLPWTTLNDREVTNRLYFHDLRQRQSIGHAQRVVIRPGDEYHVGDHIYLQDDVCWTDTDTIAIDPDIVRDVDLNALVVDDQPFADRIAAVQIIPTPNQDNSYHLRICLYSQMDQPLPSLIFYDWEYPMGLRSVDLRRFHFANKTAFIQVEAGSAYRTGDRVILWERMRTGAHTQALEPGVYNLNELEIHEHQPSSFPWVRGRHYWAETVAGLEFDLKPQLMTV